ncbi:hypothetical protein HWQ46_18605 [Shewanella sp. D64]|uniref:hypothetical protein n=1 Tax=unclassified Shewanella TaxID=196818 RepID=UPI0022BA58BF|nr:MULTISPECIES: hypothetical protein [unclassified Shewanella]MEC4727559.1 hypothetical protein [Shewanella sp. D64]MEC4739810.1 hypothetical protein [Shewanella sp. E94]WBJ95802.1 hypothetical protein HWQ47_01290 [Shewanella sp. MTB7]
MKCFDSKASREVCNKILTASEALILEHGVISFTHTSIINQQVCSSRTFYNNFNSKEDLLVCSLLRRSITYDIENFFRVHHELTSNFLIFAPALLSVEISRQDPVYLTACLSATNCGVWKLSSDDKVKTMRNIEGRYFYSMQNVAERVALEGYLEHSDEEEVRQLGDALYLYSMGKIFAIASTVSGYRPIERMRNNELEGLLAQVNRFSWREPATLEDIKMVYGLVISYLEQYRQDITCERCLYFKSTQENSMDGVLRSID